MAYKGEKYSKSKTCKSQHKHGVTSYKMQDSKLVFENLGIEQGDVIIDLGCGAGDYSFHAAELTRPTGRVYPCDKWPELKEKLEKRVKESGMKNIIPVQFDLVKDQYPFNDNFADLCLLITVFHIPVIKKYSKYILSEIKRILKPTGTLAILNCKKKDMPFGPPIEMRLSPAETQEILLKSDFTQIKKETDLENNYLSLFQYK